MGNRRLVDTTSRVDIDCVDYFIGRLSVSLRLVLILVLSRWSQQQATIWRERESSEEGRQSFVGVEIGVLHSQATAQGR